MHLLAKHFPIFFIYVNVHDLYSIKQLILNRCTTFPETFGNQKTPCTHAYEQGIPGPFFLRISAVLQLDIWPFIEWSNVTTTPLKLLYRMPRIFVAYE